MKILLKNKANNNGKSFAKLAKQVVAKNQLGKIKGGTVIIEESVVA